MRHSRFRLRIARRVAAPWVAAGLLAAVTGSAVWATVDRAEVQRRAWGPQAVALVATRPVTAGETLGPANTRRRAVPRSLLPTDSMAELPAAAVAAVPLAAGEPVRRARLVGPGVGAVGTVLVAVPTGPTSAPVHVGDRLDLYGRAAVPVARDVAAVETGADRVVVAVPAADVGPLVVALGDGPLVVTVRR